MIKEEKNKKERRGKGKKEEGREKEERGRERRKKEQGDKKIDYQEQNERQAMYKDYRPDNDFRNSQSDSQ